MPIPSQPLTQEVVEADEVIDVHMGHEDIGDLEELAGGQMIVRSEIEEKAAAFPRDVDVNRRILERVVDQTSMENRLHRVDLEMSPIDALLLAVRRRI